MSTTDDRIVNMQFDNARFEQNIQTTLASIDKLQKSLDFTNSQKSIADLGAASNKFNMEGMGQAVDGISAKFVALASVGIAAITNLTNRVVDAGLQMAKSLTIGPIGQGYQDYNSKLTSVQTIMNATGKDINEVEGYFDILDKYSDKTIYKLSDMTGAFAKFTNAGIDLKDSVPAIQGISNMVALAGQGADAASIAYYNLSQSLSGGFLTTLDFKSLNFANVATKEWKEQMIQGALAAGTLKKEADGTYTTLTDAGGGSYTMMQLFTEGLKDQWASTDVLLDVLGKYGDATTEIGKKAFASAQNVKSLPMLLDTLREAIGTSWTDTFQLILGNVTESTKLFTGLSNAIGGWFSKSGEARNNLLKQWKGLGGLTKLMDALENAFWAAVRPLIAIGRGFREMFPAETAQRLLALTDGFAKLVDKLYISNETMDKLQRIFAGLFAIVKIGWTVIKELASLFGDLLSALSPAASGLFNFSAGAGDAAVNLEKMLVDGGGIHRFFIKLRDVITKPVEFIEALATAIKKFLTLRFSENEVSKGIDTLGQNADKTASAFQRFNDNITKTLHGIVDLLGDTWKYISNWFAELGNNIAKAFQPGDFQPAVDILNAGLLTGIIVLLKNFVQGGLPGFLTGNNFFNQIGSLLKGLSKQLQAMQLKLKADALLRIAAAIAILTGSLILLASMNSEDLTRAMTAMAIGFGQLTLMLAGLDKVIGSGKAAFKIGILSGALIAMSTAIGIVAVAVKIFATLNPLQLAVGLTGIAGAMAVLVGATRLISTDASGLLTASAAMLAMSNALLLISGVVKIFATLSPMKLAQGLLAIGASLAELIAATLLMDTNAAGLLAGSAAMVAMSTALLGISAVVKIFAGIDPKALARGLLAIGAALAELVVTTLLMDTNAAGLLAGSAAMVLMAGALTVISTAVLLLGKAKPDTLEKGLITVAAILITMAGALIAMEGTLPGAAALLVAAGAMTVLASVIEVLGHMSIDQIILGITAMVGALVAVAAASVALSESIPIILGLGIALSALGLGFALFGVGVMSVAKGFEILATSGAKGAKAIVEIIKVFITARYEIIKAFVGVIVGLAEEILRAAPLLLRLFGAVLTQLLKTVVDLAPKIANALFVVIVNFLELIRQALPLIIEEGFHILMSLLKGIYDHLPEILAAGLAVMLRFIDGIVNNMSILVSAAATLIITFLLELANHAQDIIAAGTALLVSLLLGISNSINTVVDTVGTIIASFISALGDQGTKIIDAGIDLVKKLIEGLKKLASNAKEWTEAGVDIAGKFLDAVANGIVQLVDKIAHIAITFMNKLAEVIRSDDKELRGAAVNLASAILDGLTFGLSSKAGGLLDSAKGLGEKVLGAIGLPFHFGSPSKETFKMGALAAQGLANGLDSNRTAVNTASDLAEQTIEKFREQLSKLSNMDDLGDISPVITPVVDLTNVQAAGRDINGLLQASAINAAASLNNARIISTSATNQTASEADLATAPTEVTFNQTINAPKALSTNDIYRSTKSQIALAKEELGIS